MAWTTQTSPTDNVTVLNAAYMNAFEANLLALRNGEHYVKLFLNNNPAIPINTNTKVSWTDIDFQAGTIWSAGNPTRLVAPVTAKYAVAINLEWRDNSANLRNCSLVRNSPALQLDLQSQGAVGGGSNVSAYTEVALNANAYVEVQVFQSAVAGLTLHGGTVDRTRVAMWLIGV